MNIKFLGFIAAVPVGLDRVVSVQGLVELMDRQLGRVTVDTTNIQLPAITSPEEANRVSGGKLNPLHEERRLCLDVVSADVPRYGLSRSSPSPCTLQTFGTTSTRCRSQAPAG